MLLEGRKLNFLTVRKFASIRIAIESRRAYFLSLQHRCCLFLALHVRCNKTIESTTTRSSGRMNDRCKSGNKNLRRTIFVDAALPDPTCTILSARAFFPPLRSFQNIATCTANVKKQMRETGCRNGEKKAKKNPRDISIAV